MTAIHNPVIWADVPDNDVIRVGNAFYMVSTSMHSMPGGPIMKSYDLQNWELVSYLFDILSEKDGNNLENGRNIYGQGSWASSLRKVGDWYYCLFNSNDDHCAYMCRTRDIESSDWEKYRMNRFMHDPSILIDDDGRKYVLYGNHDIYLVELTEDLLGIKKGGTDRLLFTTETENIGLKAEGCHAYKIAGRYYALFIEWPSDGNGRRREVCYRWDSFEGPFEHTVILDDDMNYHNAGVAQGAIFTIPVQTDEDCGFCDGKRDSDLITGLKCTGGEYCYTPGPDGNYWASVMFQDHGAVGRIPYVLPVEWHEGWPMLGIDGFVPESFELPFDAANGTMGVNVDGNVLLAGDAIMCVPGSSENVLTCLRTGSGIQGGRFISDRTGYGLSGTDDFRRSRGQEESLADVRHLWQWNHNPDNLAWSLKERPGYLRLINMHISENGVLQARNTLTQRTFGPSCSCETHLELAGLRPGDCAGLVALQGNFGLVGIRVTDEGEYRAVMCVNDGKYREKVAAEELLDGRSDIYLKISFDFEDNRDKAVFYRSFDGKRWKQLGRPLQMKYTLDHFMGYRIGLYSYAGEKTGGYADFEYFRIQ